MSTRMLKFFAFVLSGVFNIGDAVGPDCARPEVCTSPEAIMLQRSSKLQPDLPRRVAKVQDNNGSNAGQPDEENTKKQASSSFLADAEDKPNKDTREERFMRTICAQVDTTVLPWSARCAGVGTGAATTTAATCATYTCPSGDVPNQSQIRSTTLTDANCCKECVDTTVGNGNACKGACIKNIVFAKKNCPKSCGYCKACSSDDDCPPQVGQGRYICERGYCIANPCAFCYNNQRDGTCRPARNSVFGEENCANPSGSHWCQEGSLGGDKVYSCQQAAGSSSRRSSYRSLGWDP